MHINPLEPIIPAEHDNMINWKNLSGAASALAIANLALAQKKLIVVMTPDAHTAEKYFHELHFFLKHTQLPIYLFPDRETLPYDHFSPHEDLTSERLHILSKLPHLHHGIVIAAVPTLMHRLAPKTFLSAHHFCWKIKDKLNLSVIQKELAESGYRHVEQVIQHGEFAIRGAIIDIFPMGSDLPYRIELFDNEIESMRSFDVDSQKSIEKIEAIDLLPAHEYPLTEAGITHFRTQWRATFSGNPAESPIYQQISKAQPIAGVEYYLPLFFETMHSFFDYCPADAQLILLNELPKIADHFWREVTARFEQLNVDHTRPLCAPDHVFIPVNAFFTQLKPFCQIKITENINNAFPMVQVDHRQKNPLEKLQAFIDTKPGRILICAESTGRREIILDLLKKNHIVVKTVDDWKTFLNHADPIALTVAPITNALYLPQEKLFLMTESQLYGHSIIPTRRGKKRAQDPDAIIRSLAELEAGALVVHINHGIGKYIGLEKIITDEIESEYVTIEYADQDRIYVPIHALHLMSRYSAADADRIALNKLGTQQWEKAKEKAAKQIQDIAADLLRIYAQREATQGFAFPKPSDDYFAFRQAFPFEETMDQRKAIDAVIDDMTKIKCMDRLICGDVGFGKTEVAMQAAFLAAHAGKQVALLVPTTLLANQHAQNLSDRFSEWPIKIEVLTRLQSAKIQKEIIEKIKSGKIDIIVGTHKLLNQKIQFKDLGLLIVDEEHRFGVQQKERIKSLRAHVDILTLTATPIPRTLNLSMVGMRDLSIIATPPLRRLSIKTFVHEFDETLIREAILRETMRGGQVYFLHNAVASMPTMIEKLKTILPDVSITFAHGQMPEKQLEKTMADFYHQRFQVLVASTIIESGIDIPSANTIIINDANQFGLAQLHQIRGRVGRSHHQAYAYLLVKSLKALTKDAERRLDAISELEDLGVGFQLATHDLEIRGAGELLGESQSGHMEAIGFSLYTELLDETVKALKSGKKPPSTFEKENGPDINLRICALLPENYIHDVHARLMLYKRLSNCETDNQVQEMKSELIDRFGLLPESAQHLFEVAHIKIRAKKLGIQKIEINKLFGYIQFQDKPHVDPTIIINLIQKDYKNYQLGGKNVLRFKTTSDKADARIQMIDQLFRKFE
ncbi:MAG: transcription-repair coupling factor [Gammaproteobacteria bacterium CG_4_10_14_0_8_um_filter_38_16]|nr:MAG: transcription-repair coupling factor [Gammaproteobacteria bacterium CG_4_10_14_0_8_um_filter_38_16]PJA03996.1 MAG: transcription-repair coupling factor [Gammaproteobacteria bacterium CG_4_10_14_0_2_um_filter_38_22]PJB09605.1 MAG: transcription-repair coupling factor [Gammaproteobacteria bacterium CG_4_9_14_3_um_filter_38_9]